MKSYPVILLFLLSFLTFSCTDTLTDIGKNTLSNSDSIIVKGDTFHLSSSSVFVKSITSQPDSFLLGTFYDTKFGTIRAEILAQLNCPVGFKFPANAVADSAKIYLSYYSCFGDTLSPIDVNIYEMNKATFSYTGVYSSDTLPSYFSDRSIKLGERIFKAGPNSSTRKSISFKMDNSFLTRFKNDTYYNSTSAFTNFFKGLYITANFGAATLLNIGRQQLNLLYYYHYPAYKLKDINGNDSIVMVNDYLTFPASKEVRQVNCIQHPDRSSVVLNDQVNYISSPANLQTQVTLRLNDIRTKLNAGVNGKKLTINSALLRVDVTDTDQDTLLHPVVKYLLLVKESLKDSVFENKELPTDTRSVLATYTVSLKTGSTTEYEHYYTFSVAKLIANELKNAKDKANIEPLNLRLIPVAVGTTTSSSGTTSISSVKQQYLMGAVSVKSAQNTNSPMRLSVVYSGF